MKNISRKKSLLNSSLIKNLNSWDPPDGGDTGLESEVAF